jgi:hypothetical protein
MPPQSEDYSQWNVPEALKEDVRFASKAVFGPAGDALKLDTFRICWYVLSLFPSIYVPMAT